MNILTIVDFLKECLIADDTEWWPIEASRGENAIYLNAALAVVSGMSEEIIDRNELRAAIRHGDALVMSGVIEITALVVEAEAIQEAAITWDEVLRTKRREIAMLN